VASGAALIAILTVIAKAFGAAREVGIAWRFGISSTVDAYQLALTITTLLPMMLTSVTTVVLVPRLVALKTRGEDYTSFIAELNGTALLLGAGVAALTVVGAPAAAALLGHGNPNMQALTAVMSRSMAPVALLTIIGGYLTARLQARERFAYSVTEAVPSATIALFAVVPGSMSGAPRLIWGTLTGFLLQTLILLSMVHKRGGSIERIRIRHRSNEWRSLYRSVVVMTAAQALLAVTIPVDQAFAARLGPGAVATLGYASRTVSLVTAFGAVVLARALLPVLSGAAAAGDLRLGCRQARQWSGLLLACGGIAALLIWLLSDFAVGILFQRGAFTGEDTHMVSAVLRIGALQLPFYFAGLAIVQWIAALGRYSTLLIVACVGLATKIAVNLLLVPLLGLQGIMLGTAAMYAISFLLQFRAAAVR
jgi:peptidoglycan biosynthesis protein MviN/MurJ (putative lipid II flippase)